MAATRGECRRSNDGAASAGARRTRGPHSRCPWSSRYDLRQGVLRQVVRRVCMIVWCGVCMSTFPLFVRSLLLLLLLRSCCFPPLLSFDGRVFLRRSVSSIHSPPCFLCRSRALPGDHARGGGAMRVSGPRVCVAFWPVLTTDETKRVAARIQHNATQQLLYHDTAGSVRGAEQRCVRPSGPQQ